MPLPAGLKGKVLVADPKWNFVVLNVGEDQGVLERGELLVNRNGKLVAKVVVRSVQKDRCIANVLPGWELGRSHGGRPGHSRPSGVVRVLLSNLRWAFLPAAGPGGLCRGRLRQHRVGEPVGAALERAAKLGNRPAQRHVQPAPVADSRGFAASAGLLLKPSARSSASA